MRRAPLPRRLRSGIWALAALLALGGCADHGISLLHPHGMVADAQRRWLIDIVLLMQLVVFPVFVLLPLVAWRYRRRARNAAYRPDWQFSKPIEFAVWGLPVVIVAALALIIVYRETPLDPYRPLPGGKTPLEVQVVALDWKFLFIYPQQHVAAISLLAIPQDRPVHFRLTSDATMQSFFIPSLGSQIYVMAGMVTQLSLQANRPASLLGENTQFNGMHFQDDRFNVKVMTAADFARWVADQRAAGRTLGPGEYQTMLQRNNTAGTRQSFGVPGDAPLTFGDVQPELFASVVAKYHPGETPMQVASQAAETLQLRSR